VIHTDNAEDEQTLKQCSSCYRIHLSTNRSVTHSERKKWRFVETHWTFEV